MATPKDIELMLNEAYISFRQREGLPNLHYLQDDFFQPPPSGIGSSSHDNGEVEMAASGETSAQVARRQGRKRRLSSAGREKLTKNSGV